MIEICDLTKEKKLSSYKNDIKKYLKKAFIKIGLNNNMNLSLILVNNSYIKKINMQFRHIDKVTDVLSFAEIDSDDEYSDDSYLGDIFINVDRVYSQSKKYGHSIRRELIFLFLHGLLHLCGYDHTNKIDENRMFMLQDEIIGNLK